MSNFRDYLKKYIIPLIIKKISTLQSRHYRNVSMDRRGIGRAEHTLGTADFRYLFSI